MVGRKQTINSTRASGRDAACKNAFINRLRILAEGWKGGGREKGPGDGETQTKGERSGRLGWERCSRAALRS